MHGMLNHAHRAPATLQLVGVSTEQAERLLAAIWCVLEAHALASPTIKVRSAAGLIDISLTFGSAEDCSIVRACWRSARWLRRRRNADYFLGGARPVLLLSGEAGGRANPSGKSSVAVGATGSPRTSAPGCAF